MFDDETEIDYKEDRYLNSIEYVNNELFRDAKFYVAFYVNELNELLTDEKEIIIKNETDTYLIKGENLTIKYVLEELVKQNLELNGNDNVIEGFKQKINNEYELMLYSSY
jgi:hypothetical protein